MNREKRFDKLSIPKYEKTPQGYLNISGIVTRSGLFDYPTGLELRSKEEVENKKSLDTIYAIPVTYNHPPDLLNDMTTFQYQKGIVASPAYTTTDENTGETLVCIDNIIIQDPTLIYEIEQGLTEFSLGYDADIYKTDGEYNGQKYSFEQKNIVYNHLALVSDGRCGEICSITDKKQGENMTTKMDCSDKKMDEEKSPEEKPETEKKDEVSPGESEVSKKMFEMLGMIIEKLEKLGDKKPEKTDESMEEEKDEDQFYDKKMDSLDSDLSRVKFVNQQRADSTFKTYNRDEFIKNLLNGGK